MARILVAEDDADIRHVIAHLLTGEGHQVLGVGDGATALEQIRSNPPDLLILDIMMPQVDGYDVLKAVQNLGLGDTTRVLVLSAKAAERDFAASLDLGASKHMTKPFDPDELVEAVSNLLDFSSEDVQQMREEERDRANLLSQLESLFDR